MQKINVEYTDTFGGEANYAWVRRVTISVPELPHYGYTGSPDGSYFKASKAQKREIMRLGKKALGLTNLRGTLARFGDTLTFRPSNSCTIVFFTYI